jgi:maltooligosyltrehalose synthase
MESGTHGYDVVDYFRLDRRLGRRSTMARMAAQVHGRGLKLVLNGVFDHVGRDFLTGVPFAGGAVQKVVRSESYGFHRYG